MSTRSLARYILMSCMIILFLGVMSPVHSAAKKTKLNRLGAACVKNRDCASGSCEAKKCVQYIEWDAVNTRKGDAPNSAALAQTAEPLKPGKYGTREVKPWTFGLNRLSSKKDVDFYKVVRTPGIAILFTVTPSSTKQDVYIGVFDSSGNLRAGSEKSFTSYKEGSDTKKSSGAVTETGGPGITEEIIIYSGIRKSTNEDQLITTYLSVGGDPGTYTIELKEKQPKDANGLDASATVRNATKIDYNKTYNGYLYYGDGIDCYEIDPIPATGKTLTISLKPENSTTDTELKYYNFYSNDGLEVHPTGSNVFDGLKLGEKNFSGKEITSELVDGGPGFEDRFIVFPYYALSSKYKGNSSSTYFTYFCVTEKHGGFYDLTVSYK